MPRLTRPDLYFAITVLPEFPGSADGRRILTRYRTMVVLASAIALPLLCVGGPRGSLALPVAALLVQDAGWLAAYFLARAQVKPHAAAATTIRDALLSSTPARIPGSWPVLVGPFILLGAVAFYLNHRWADIPERFPIHWGLDGHPNGWATHTVAGVYGPLCIAAVVCIMLTALAYGILHGTRLIRPGGRAGEAEAGFRVTVARIVIGAEYLLAAVFGWTAILPLMKLASAPPVVWGVLVPTLAFVVVAIALVIRKGQGGTRLLRESPEIGADDGVKPVGDRTEDRYWKAGFLYVNPQDPAFLVEKRFGLGYTLNFGHPGAWMILAALVLAPLVVGLVVALAGK
jgi:uncharacterized membrane protein